MRRALVICAPSPLEIGQAPVGTVKVLRAMLDMGWNLDILGFRWHAGGSSDPFFSRMLDGARVHEADGVFGKPAGWVPKAVQKGRRLLASGRYDLLLSFAHLTWAHVVALILKRSFPVPWVASSSDPWSNRTLGSPSPLRRAVEQKLELSVYRSADALVFTCPQLQAWMLGPFNAEPELSAKSFNLPHFFDRSLFPPCRVGAEDGTTHIRHIGTVPPGGYVPAFFEALRRLLDADRALDRQLAVTFHGGYRPNPHETVRRLGLERCVGFQPSVDYPASLRLMKEADALLFFGLPPTALGGLGTATLHLKFCDYIGAERPIFALAGRGSPAYEALDGTTGLCADEDPAVITTQLKRFLETRELAPEHVREGSSRARVQCGWERVFEFAIARCRAGR